MIPENMKYASFSAWLSGLDEVTNDRLRLYYKANPEKFPDFIYIPYSVCVENGIIEKVEVKGGCSGNLQGVSRLVEGLSVDEVLQRLEGISCNGGPTSCPDQLCRALREAQKSL